ncbi:MAG: helix-turn-helix domain-containing protein [Actinomycetota bacterium]|nr:helix-turn-helix domain-containing protein [Actinomycetota bacterium]
MVKAATTIDADVGERLFVLRRERGMSQSELARRAEVNRTSVVFAENGRTIPRPSTLRRLAWALDVSMEELSNGGPSEEKKT